MRESQMLLGATHLANLTCLGLYSNDIGDEGGAALLGAAHLASLTQLNLGDNGISDPVMELLRRRWPFVDL